LKQSDIGTLNTFAYPNEASILRAQQVLIEIGLHCLKYIDWVEEGLKAYYNDTLDKIYSRHELRINNMGFNTVNMNNKIKIKICLDFAYFMYKTLEYCIMKID